MKVIYLYSIYYCEKTFEEVHKYLKDAECKLLLIDPILPEWEPLEFDIEKEG